MPYVLNEQYYFLIHLFFIINCGFTVLELLWFNAQLADGLKLWQEAVIGCVLHLFQKKGNEIEMQ